MDQLSTALKSMSMEDVLLVLKDVQLKNQALQEQNRRLLTAPTLLPNTAGSSTSPQDTSRAERSANDSASTTDTSALFVRKESRKELEYSAMKMVVFAHVWWEKKGIFGVRLDSESARRKLNAATLTNFLDTGVQRPSQDRVMVLQLILKLYTFLPEAFHPLVSATIAGEYLKLFKIMRDVGGVRWSTFLNRFRNVAAEIFEGDSAKVYSRHPPCLFANGFTMGGTVFRTIYGVKILTCLLWGSTALNDQRITTKGTNGDLWHITEVNSVAIAFAAIVIRYLLAGNPEFTPVGKISGINYLADFEYYVERIEDQLKKGTKSMHDTLKFYNNHIFPPTQDRRSRAITTIPVSLTEEEEAFWHELEAIDKEPDLDSDSADQTHTVPVVPADVCSAFSLELETPMQLASTTNVPSAISVQAQTPMQLVSTTNGVPLDTTDRSDRVRSKAKGKKRSGPAPTVTRVTRATRSRGGQVHGDKVGAEAPIPSAMRKRKGGKNSTTEGPSDASHSVGRAKSAATTLAKAVTFVPLPTVVSDMVPNGTFIGDNVDQSDDDYDSEEEEEEEEE
ncbi:hypothetical protein ARMGADRAFT_1033533 [Armillaria gallica]|uniref:Uncharacterized protein n=1 Tax=Armillaria gallica TaxID=47427 RepID=A0A2H3D0U7_ARMGA|nr:hypothetical protein ARMGADRAFT_1033533 [Armillaria gallica]